MLATLATGVLPFSQCPNLPARRWLRGPAVAIGLLLAGPVLAQGGVPAGNAMPTAAPVPAASGPRVPLLEDAAAEVLPAADLARLAAQKWLDPQPNGCRFRLADPPSSFTQFFTTTDMEGLTERDCAGFRMIGLYKKNVLIGPAVWRSKSSQNILIGRSWVNDQLEGPGVEIFSDGVRAEGSFVRSQLEGPATVRFTDGAISTA